MLQNILIVEEDPEARESLALQLGSWFRVKAVGRAAEARALLTVYGFDLVVASAGSRTRETLELCRHIRETSSIPFILLGACDREENRLASFEAGVDDYVIQPFSFRELLARVCAMLRRAESFRRPEKDARYAFGDWIFDTGPSELIQADGLCVPLSAGECRLLLALVERPQVVMTRHQLMALIEGRRPVEPVRSIDNHISRLRRKLEPNLKRPCHIKTVRGGGYVFAVGVRRV